MRPVDVAIVGAGPAGTTAALLLARSGASTAVFERAPLPRRRPLAGWVNCRTRSLLCDIDSSLAGCFGPTIDDIQFYKHDFSQRIQPGACDDPALLIEPADVDAQLVESARKAGAIIHDTTPIRTIQPAENQIAVTSESGQTYPSRRIIVATGSSADLLDDVGIAPPHHRQPTQWAHVEQAADQPNVQPRLSVVLDTGRQRHFCVAIDQPAGVSATLYADGNEAQPVERLATYCAMLKREGRLSADLEVDGKSVTIRTGFASTAMELDSHVGKHALVIGDAGGFQSAASLEGVFTAIWSARIAAEVMLESLTARHPQDTLLTFDHRWRVEMADYLRSPNTDMSLIMPLVFSNQAMADRLAAAFFAGQNM